MKKKKISLVRKPIMTIRHFFWCQAFKKVISTWTATYYSEFITNFQPNEWKTFLYIAQVTSNKILLYSIFLRLSSDHSHWIMLNSYFLLRHSSLGQAKPLHSSALTHPLGKELNPSQGLSCLNSLWNSTPTHSPSRLKKRKKKSRFSRRSSWHNITHW